MKEKQIIVYEAEDGTEFNTMTECANYEAKIKWRPEVEDVLRRLKAVCDENTCSSCFLFDTVEGHCFFSKSLVPCNFEISKIMKGEL